MRKITGKKIFLEFSGLLSVIIVEGKGKTKEEVMKMRLLVYAVLFSAGLALSTSVFAAEQGTVKSGPCTNCPDKVKRAPAERGIYKKNVLNSVTPINTEKDGQWKNNPVGHKNYKITGSSK
jgi:hypothetical protein